MIDLDVSSISAITMEEACKRRLYSRTSVFNLNDNSLLIFTLDVDPHYRLSVFPSELKENVENLLQKELSVEFIKYSRREACQRDDSPHISHQKVKNYNPQLVLIQKNFLVSILLIQRKNSTQEELATIFEK